MSTDRAAAKTTAAADHEAVASSSKGTATTYYQSIRERRNWYIHQLYVRQEFANCLTVIEAQLRETEGTCEYALYVKGLLKRTEGQLGESLSLLQTAVLVSPENVTNRKQFARALHLVGRHKDAIEVFREAEAVRMSKRMSEDWELTYNIGVCHVYLRQYDHAIASFTQSLNAQRNDCTYLQLVEVLLLVHNYDNATAMLEEALTFSPENPEILVRLGQLYLRQGKTKHAFDVLGRCLTLDPTNTRAVVAAASIIQDNGDYDVALSKYRIAVTRVPDSARLWNNIGICFFGKRNVYAAVACLRKSIFLMPLEWITQYNMGIVFLFMGRYASAFQHLSAAVCLHAKYAPVYMYMGVCLSLMNDIDNACAAYRKAIDMDPDPLFRLNYVITLFNSGFPAEALEQFMQFLAQWEVMSTESRRGLAGGTVFAPEIVRDLQARFESLNDTDLVPHGNARLGSAPDTLEGDLSDPSELGSPSDISSRDAQGNPAERRAADRATTAGAAAAASGGGGGPLDEPARDVVRSSDEREGTPSVAVRNVNSISEMSAGVHSDTLATREASGEPRAPSENTDNDVDGDADDDGEHGVSRAPVRVPSGAADEEGGDSSSSSTPKPQRPVLKASESEDSETV